jgi:hypothetical protein
METKDILGFVLTGINISITLANFIVVNYIAKRQDAHAKNYTELDKTYDGLLKEATAYPDFRNPNFAQKYCEYKQIEGEKYVLAQQYEIYAFRCMNFCETIFDISDSNLLETWNCIIKTESKLHATWFNQTENQERFKEKFKKYVGNDCVKLHKN